MCFISLLLLLAYLKYGRTFLDELPSTSIVVTHLKLIRKGDAYKVEFYLNSGMPGICLCLEYSTGGVERLQKYI